MSVVLRIVDMPGIMLPEPPPVIGHYVQEYDPSGTMLPGLPPVIGHYIQEYDPSYRFPIGRVVTTENKCAAQRFENMSEALAFWQQQVGDTPRWDGKPNRPLTAFTVEVEPA